MIHGQLRDHQHAHTDRPETVQHRHTRSSSSMCEVDSSFAICLLQTLRKLLVQASICVIKKQWCGTAHLQIVYLQQQGLTDQGLTSRMQEGGKIAVAVSVTFMSGVVVGWLLNTYTRKVSQGCNPSSSCCCTRLSTLGSPSSAATVMHPAATPCDNRLCRLLCAVGVGKVLVQHAGQGQEPISSKCW
jgi:hypothetical protein